MHMHAAHVIILISHDVDTVNNGAKLRGAYIKPLIIQCPLIQHVFVYILYSSYIYNNYTCVHA